MSLPESSCCSKPVRRVLVSPLSFVVLLSPQLPTIIDLLMADEVSLADLDWCAAMTKHVGHFQVCAVSHCCAVVVAVVPV